MKEMQKIVSTYLLFGGQPLFFEKAERGFAP
jgi:hypothetical protein